MIQTLPLLNEQYYKKEIFNKKQTKKKTRFKQHMSEMRRSPSFYSFAVFYIDATEKDNKEYNCYTIFHIVFRPDREK